MYIDLSKYNRVTDWRAVANNVEGAILRVGYRGYGSGKIILDSMFETYAKECYNHNIPFGLYFMSQAITVMEAIEEADFATTYAERYNATLPIFIDSEDGDGTAKVVRADGLSKELRTDICNFFCKTIQNSRRKAGIYASTSWFKDKLDVSKLDKYLLWVAQYGPECKAKHRVDMWQYTSSGAIKGITGKVDCSVLYGFPANNTAHIQTTLKKGSKGLSVKALQERLNYVLHIGLVCDGIYGANTEAAVKQFQQNIQINVDGEAGPLTLKLLSLD